MWEKYNFLGKSPTWGLKVVYTLFCYWGKKKEKEKKKKSASASPRIVFFFDDEKLPAFFIYFFFFPAFARTKEEGEKRRGGKGEGINGFGKMTNNKTDHRLPMG